MLGKLVLIMMLLCVAVSAENVLVGNYSIEFNYTDPHNISIIDTNTTVIKTFDGFIMFSPMHSTARQAEQALDRDFLATDLGSMRVQNNYHTVYKYNGLYAVVPDDGLLVQSNFDLTRLSDFLHSLKIEKAKP